MDLQRIAGILQDHGLAAWLVHDFRGSNPVLGLLLPGSRTTTRRVDLLIPADGEPVLLVHALDAPQFARTGVRREIYTTQAQWEAFMGRVARLGRVAVEYSPRGTLPGVSFVDAGTMELLRECGADVVSSADVISAAVAVWSPEARAGHARAATAVARIKDAAFDYIRRALIRGQRVDEVSVQRFILEQFHAAGLETRDAPIVAVNEHSGDPHYEPRPDTSSPIRPGDWILVDLWGRLPGDANVYADITWVAYAGPEVPPEPARIFEAVRAAREAALALARARWLGHQPVQGWELDDAARSVLERAGLGLYIRHRTGHSLSPGPLVHGLGMNLDNFETHDTRRMLPGTGFTIEPGVYLPAFGVRLEINVFVDEQAGPVIAGCVQDEVVRLV